MQYFFKRKKIRSFEVKKILLFVLMLSIILSMMISAHIDGVVETNINLNRILMTLNFEIPRAGKASKLFNADSGIFADVSNLSVWSNNTQRVISGKSRTPIVFNNAQTTGGWKPVSVVGLDNADAFQIKFSTIGYENIRFTCMQKSSGRGPDAFLLAYSIGSSTGSYTEIPYSATGTNGIPAINRMSNNNYNALQLSYENFILPTEMENQTEVYLRVVFNGRTNLGKNGNTSINNIVIIGDKKDN